MCSMKKVRRWIPENEMAPHIGRPDDAFGDPNASIEYYEHAEKATDLARGRGQSFRSEHIKSLPGRPRLSQPVDSTTSGRN